MVKVIINEDSFKRLLLGEDRNPAFERGKVKASNIKAIWRAIDAKRKVLQDELFGDLSDKLDDITKEKISRMGEKYARVPETVVTAGNDKLPRDVMIVNMSSSLMCPSFYLGTCLITQGACYAQKQENRLTTNVMPKEWSTDIMTTRLLGQYESGNKKPMRDYFSLIEHYIQLGNAYSENLTKKEIKRQEAVYGRELSEEEKEMIRRINDQFKIRDIRLNESGDFHCQLAVDLWAKFADKVKRKYGISTHAYTARGLDFSKAQKSMTINASNDSPIFGNEPKRKFKAVSDKIFDSLVGGDTARFGQPILGKTEKGEYFYKCPCEAGNPQCDFCRVCFNKNKTNVPYTIYVRYHGVTAANGLKSLFKTNEVDSIIQKMYERGWITDKEYKKYTSKDQQTRLKNLSDKIDTRRNA